MSGDFDAFVARHEPVLRRVFVARYGGDRGREATAEALAYAWEHWAEVGGLDNPVAYLFTVGRSRTRARRAPRWRWRVEHHEDPPPGDPAMAAALGRLSPRQRECVVLVAACGFRYQEAAECLGISKSSVQQHLERGLARLRTELGVDDG